MRDSRDATQREPLPALELPVRIHRDRGRIECPSGELYVGPMEPHDGAPRIVEFKLDGALLPDEMVLIIGRTLDWTGPTSRIIEDLPLLEGVFPEPFVLTRSNPTIKSDLPIIRNFPNKLKMAGWSFLTLLLRGDDTPWVAPSVLRLRITRSQ